MEVWQEGHIKDFSDVKGGKRLPKGKQLVRYKTAHPYIRIRDIGKIKTLELTTDYEYVDDETQQSIAKYIVNEGDILISVVGTIGLIGVVGKSLNKANQTENCDKITNIRGINRDYLYYYLISPYGQGEIQKATVGAVQPKLPLKNIQDLIIRFPSLDTQQKIAELLSTLDEKIEENERINKNLTNNEPCESVRCDASGSSLTHVGIPTDSYGDKRYEHVAKRSANIVGAAWRVMNMRLRDRYRRRRSRRT